jgi:hypothetical protein
VPIDYRPDYAQHIAYITGSGRVGFEDCLGLIRGQQADVGRRLHELNDYRGIELALEAHQVEDLAAMNRELYSGMQNIRFAVVVDSDLGFGMARMFEVYLHESVEFRVFREYEAALAWVQEAAAAEPDGTDAA